jgi:hypothetical protein
LNGLAAELFFAGQNQNNRRRRYNGRMPDVTSSSTSSSASIIESIVRLLAPDDRAAYREMLQTKLRDRDLANDELRRVAESTWREFLGYS